MDQLSMMKFYTNILLLASCVAIMACGTPEKNATEKTTEDHSVAETPMPKGVPSTVDAYMELKNALVASDAELAKKKAQTLMSAIPASEIALVEAAAPITQTKDIEKQREQLPALTDALVELVNRRGNGGQKLYYQHCPMAFDNLGASWLSTEKEIRNPYFGDRMLTCGRVEKEL